MYDILHMTHKKLNIFEMHRMSIEQYKQSRKTPLVCVLDDVRSMYNVGSVFRSADAMRVAEIVLCGITPRPPHAEIHKTALGAEDSVEWTYRADAMDAVTELKQRGYVVLAVEQAEGSILLHKFADEIGLFGWEDALNHGIAIVLGNEVKGVRQEVVDRCDACIEIPQFGTKHSLNVSTAAGIVMWEIAKCMMPHMLHM